MKKLLLLVSLFLVVTLGCIPVSIPTPTERPEGPPNIVALDITPTEITVGGSATLIWNVTGATSISIDQGVGTVGAAGTKVISPSATTAYTITATNAAGTVTKSVVVYVKSTPEPPPLGDLPVIVSFSATPPDITLGDSVTLLWNVTGATSVSIDQGVGAVAVAGTNVVSPIITTVYTLTATNAAGSVTNSVTVTVGVVPPPTDTTPPSVPALVSPANGITLPQPSSPWAFDWGDSSDSESGIKQYELYLIHTGAINPVIDDYVTTSAYSKTVGGYIASASLTGWKWKVRAQNNAGLWSDWSAERTFNVEPKVAYDFVGKASTATWWSTSIDTPLPFPGGLSDTAGFACYRTSIKLNDGNTYAKVLETHPKWVDNGWISGKYASVSVPNGAKLRVKFGFINGASAGKVKFRIGKFGDVAVFSLVSDYAGGVKEAEVSLSAYGGQTIDFVLGVNAAGSSAQDWAAWVEAKIIY